MFKLHSTRRARPELVMCSGAALGREWPEAGLWAWPSGPGESPGTLTPGRRSVSSSVFLLVPFFHGCVNHRSIALKNNLKRLLLLWSPGVGKGSFSPSPAPPWQPPLLWLGVCRLSCVPVPSREDAASGLGSCLSAFSSCFQAAKSLLSTREKVLFFTFLPTTS